MPTSGQQPEHLEFAPGWPGIAPRWTSSAKVGVGMALGSGSRIWFTLSDGILNEVYFPRIDQACIRDLGLLVTGPNAFYSEIKRDAQHQVAYLYSGVPAFRLTNTCAGGRFRMVNEVVADTERDVVLQQIQFEPLVGGLSDYRVFVLLAPHLDNKGSANTGWIGDYKGLPMLFAERPGVALALASNAPWLLRSAGFAGTSDGWTELKGTGTLSHTYSRAENGNIALLGEIDLQACSGMFTLALAFSRTTTMSGFRARESLLRTYASMRDRYVAAWQDWLRGVASIVTGNPEIDAIIAASAAVLRTHEEKGAPGGIVASLLIPWGNSKGDDDLGGYHLVWPRDLVEAAGGLLALGLHDDARRVVAYLHTTQNPDGSWPQNMWLDGTPYWSGVQMDEAAFPILLAELALREGAIELSQEAHLLRMVQLAAGFIVRNGPVSQEDRWEEDAGYSPFTLAVEIAALRAAARLAQQISQPDIARYLNETAGAWDAAIERWTYVRDTATLCTHTASGPVWHRYTGDGYGEHADGTPFDGTGIGRGWPLFAGERGHYELAAGNRDQALKMLQTMAQQAGDGGMLPEQIWDAADIPVLGLRNGRPAGSAMPLVWAHAEFVKLARSLRDGAVFDRPAAQTPAGTAVSQLSIWRFNNKLRTLPAGNTLRIDVLAAVQVHWSADGWHTANDTIATPSGLGTWYVDLPPQAAGGKLVFTFLWTDQHRWENVDYAVDVETIHE